MPIERTQSALKRSCGKVQAFLKVITGSHMWTASLRLPGPGLPMKKSPSRR